MVIVGIDAGLTGAIAFIQHSRHSVVDIPTFVLPGAGAMVRRRVDGRGVADIIRAGVPSGETCMVAMEQLRARPMTGKGGNSAQGIGSMMRTLGVIEGVLDVMRIKPVMVEPQTWKRFYKLGKKKDESLRIARDFFPSAELHLAKHHNRAEALLIAHWAFRTKT